jgi:hypothetical protein
VIRGGAKKETGTLSLIKTRKGPVKLFDKRPPDRMKDFWDAWWDALASGGKLPSLDNVSKLPKGPTSFDDDTVYWVSILRKGDPPSGGELVSAYKGKDLPKALKELKA